MQRSPAIQVGPARGRQHAASHFANARCFGRRGPLAPPAPSGAASARWTALRSVTCVLFQWPWCRGPARSCCRSRACRPPAGRPGRKPSVGLRRHGSSRSSFRASVSCSRLGRLFLGQKGLVPQLLGPFEGGQGTVVPDTLDIGIAPRRAGQSCAFADCAAASAGVKRQTQQSLQSPPPDIDNSSSPSCCCLLAIWNDTMMPPNAPGAQGATSEPTTNRRPQAAHGSGRGKPGAGRRGPR